MKMLHKRMLSMVLACIMFFSMMSIPSLGSGSANPILTATASTDLPIDPIQNPLYGSWSTYQYYLSSDPVNSMIYGNGEDIVSVIDKARNPYSYPTIYLTSSAFFIWQVKKGVYTIAKPILMILRTFPTAISPTIATEQRIYPPIIIM